MNVHYCPQCGTRVVSSVSGVKKRGRRGSRIVVGGERREGGRRGGWSSSSFSFSSSYLPSIRGECGAPCGVVDPLLYFLGDINRIRHRLMEALEEMGVACDQEEHVTQGLLQVDFMQNRNRKEDGREKGGEENIGKKKFCMEEGQGGRVRRKGREGGSPFRWGEKFRRRVEFLSCRPRQGFKPYGRNAEVDEGNRKKEEQDTCIQYGTGVNQSSCSLQLPSFNVGVIDGILSWMDRTATESKGGDLSSSLLPLPPPFFTDNDARKEKQKGTQTKEKEERKKISPEWSVVPLPPPLRRVLCAGLLALHGGGSGDKRRQQKGAGQRQGLRCPCRSSVQENSPSSRHSGKEEIRLVIEPFSLPPSCSCCCSIHDTSGTTATTTGRVALREPHCRHNNNNDFTRDSMVTVEEEEEEAERTRPSEICLVGTLGREEMKGLAEKSKYYEERAKRACKQMHHYFHCLCMHPVPCGIITHEKYGGRDMGKVGKKVVEEEKEKEGKKGEREEKDGGGGGGGHRDKNHLYHSTEEKQEPTAGVKEDSPSSHPATPSPPPLPPPPPSLSGLTKNFNERIQLYDALSSCQKSMYDSFRTFTQRLEVYIEEACTVFHREMEYWQNVEKVQSEYNILKEMERILHHFRRVLVKCMGPELEKCEEEQEGE